MKQFIKQLTALSLTSLLFLTSYVHSAEVVQLNLPSSNKVVIKLMFNNGSISDPKGKEGLTFTTATSIIKGGTSQLTASEIRKLRKPMAVRMGVTVDKEVTTFRFSVHQDFLAEFYPIIKGLMLTPAFAEKDFIRLLDQQQNAVDKSIRASSDEEYSKKALEDLLFRGTNYQHMVIGKSASVKNISLVDVQKHYQQVFTRHNVTLGIAGNYDKKFLAQLQADMQGLSAVKPKPIVAGKGNTPNGINIEIIAKDNAFGSSIFTGFPMDITRADDDFAALMIANSWLGEHRKSYSKLYQKIRTARSMNYGDYSYIEWYEKGGSRTLPGAGTPRSSNYMALWIRPVQIAKQLKQQYKELSGIKVGHAHFALRLAIRELELLIQNGLLEQDFEETRAFLKSYTKLYAQTASKRLGYLLDSSFYGREDYLAELDVLLSKVTLKDVNRVIKKYWQTQNMFVTIVTDKSEATALAASLLNNTPSPMSYSNLVKKGLSAELLKEDDEISVFPLNVTSVKIIQSKDTFK